MTLSPEGVALGIFPFTSHCIFGAGTKAKVLVLVLLPAQGPNKERPGPQPCHGMPCAVATKAHAVLITLLIICHACQPINIGRCHGAH
ncbi:uncharacterized protein ARMOST_22110 [Armillaria ostoyae]|uniref:Uncharacterized protein n=1 Tax=Armillaria ostoyae TaxID=47428 RepID=A0A284SBY4_ARMOS|nr:uncharacterized protein ARMOST_22110 [Armillaria ostoyae]